MTNEEASISVDIYPGDLVEWVDEPDRWGKVVSVCNCKDAGICVYYVPNGAGLFYSGVRPELLRVWFRNGLRIIPNNSNQV